VGSLRRSVRTAAVTRTLGLLAASAALAATVPTAPVGAAPPECTDIGISTRQCTRGPGHTAITTTPDPAFTDPGAGWGFGTLGFPAIGPGGDRVWPGF